MSTEETNISKKVLNDLCKQLAGKLEEVKHPLIIEFAGTPKAGKTTCVDAIARFFRRNDIPVHIITERASLCPIIDKHHLFFNTWTGSTSLAQLLEAREKRVPIIILDRGIFDTLVWMNFLQTWQAITPDELKKIEDYYLLNRCTSLVNIVVALSADPKIALAREFKDQIIEKHGSIMNPENLFGYNESLKKALVKYKDNFQILNIDTTKTIPVEGVKTIAYELLKTAQRLVDEDIAVVERSYIEKGEFQGPVISRAASIEEFMIGLEQRIKWVKRADAEKDNSLVQIIPVAVIKRANEVLVFNIRGEAQGRLTNRNSIWAGGHIRNSDKNKWDRFIGNMFHSCLARELDEEIRITLDLNDLMALPNAIIWDTSNPRSAQHLALFYDYGISTKAPKKVLHEREFYETKSKSLFTKYRSVDRLLELNDWETWSIYFMKYVLKLDIPLSDKQSILL